MATFFGEILPVTSRAVDEDDEEDDVEIPECEIRVRWSSQAQTDMKCTKSKKLICDTLIIAIGPAATGFVRTFIVHEKFETIGGVFGGMKEGDVNTFHQLSPTDKTCYIYRSKKRPGLIVCQCNLDIKPEQSHSFAEKLFAGIDVVAAYTSILCEAFTTDYKHEIPVSEMSVPFLRALKTVKFAGTPLSPYLEQPNVLTGLPAQLLSYCQMLGARAVMYICYTDSIHLDTPTMKTFLPLLNSTPIKDVIEKNPTADETLLNIVQQHAYHNTLYL